MGELTPEQEEYLRQNLNLVERLGTSLSFIDEYLRLLLDTQNNLLEAIKGLSLGGITTPELGKLADAINALVAMLGAPGAVALENPSQIASGQVLCAVIGQGYSLPGYDVPWDKQVVIKALPTNAGVIRVGNTRAAAVNPSTGYPLIANEGIGYKIKNTGHIWISATVAAEGIHWTVEQE